MQDQTHNPSDFLDFVAPVWFEELATGLAIRSMFVLSGNVRDLYPIKGDSRIEFVDFESAVWMVLEEQGYAALLIHDPVDGLRLHPECDPRLAEVLESCGIALGTVAETPAELTALARQVAREVRVPAALMLDYASIALRDDRRAVERMFVALDKIARGPTLTRGDLGPDCPARNPILWVLDRSGDLPEWFIARNPFLRDLKVGLPDLSDRIAYLNIQAEALADAGEIALAKRQEIIETFSVRCEGLTLRDVERVVALSRAEDFGLTGITEALRSYQIGTTRNPWTSQVMRIRIKNARQVLEKRVKGQPRGVEKTYDILVRAIMGLSGAQTSSRGNRPRGVLFFVGPTGTGKTELAKALTEVMFGDENAMHRFDMSEFMNEESVGRLVGPPPGAPGYEEGGELVNAARERPFSVFLFDEIEKSHPRILDTFLQILDDGRLSDSRGETAFFSESLIIFTSNIGMVGGDRAANAGQRILPSDGPDVIEEKLTAAVADHFRYELRRPELFNRIGQNVVPFEFINPRSSVIIFNAVLKKVCAAVREEHDVEIRLTQSAHAALLEMCTEDLNDGGRGIGNRLETFFINPLSRILFARPHQPVLTVTGLQRNRREVEMTVQ
ncbi:MAG: AAA family ATPase [Pseudomonadota bacterium]